MCGADPDFLRLEREREDEQIHEEQIRRYPYPSYCANSDLFTHDAFDTPRDISDEHYKAMAKFFR